MVKRILYLLIFLLFSLPLSAARQEPVCDKLLVGGSHRWIPVSFLEKDGQSPSGIGYDLIKHIAGQLHLELDINPQLPWKRALQYLKNGQLDVVSALYWTKERSLFFHYTQAYFYNEPRIFVLKDKVFPYQKFEDLIGLTGVVPTGGSFGEAFDRFARENQLELHEVNSKRLMIKALINGVADYFIQDHLDALSYLKLQHLDSEIIALPNPVSVTPVHFAISKKSPCAASLAKINREIVRAKENGTLASIIQHYLPNDEGESKAR